MANRTRNAQTLVTEDTKTTKKKLTAESEAIVAAITAQFEVKIDSLHQELSLMKAELLGEIGKRDAAIDKLKLELNTVRTRTAKLEEKLEDSEAYERRDTIVLSGNGLPEYSRGEISCNVVRKLLADKLHLQTSIADISTAHRLGKPPQNQSPDKRNIIVKLCRRDLKSDIFNACRQLKPDIYINESLSPLRSTILYVLRQLKRRVPECVSGCTSQNGRVYVFLRSQAENSTDRTIKVLVNSETKLRDICRNASVSLESIIENWPH